MMTVYLFPVNSDGLLRACKLWDFKNLHLICVNEWTASSDPSRFNTGVVFIQ